MTDIALRIDHLGKRYRIGARRERYRTLRETVMDILSAPVRLPARAQRDTIWALSEVSLEVKRGDVVGIIGPNGAGKSTLLKILARITEPTTGLAEIHGRVGCLLEVGTGFHPELTGRENIYLNGAILGMKRAEIERQFDAIVAFAEVEQFVDTPVKHYSSGMYLRLAFAVAAHLEPEILIVDEVLAVGDMSFQKKCLNKMQDVGREGRTVLFVSHTMPAITRLCARAILLEGGRVVRDGRPHEVVAAYSSSGLGTRAAREWRDPATAPGAQVARLRAVRVRDEDDQLAGAADIRRPLQVEMEYDVVRAGYVLEPYFQFYNEAGVYVFAVSDLDPTWRGRGRPLGTYVSTVWIPGNLLSEGTLFVTAALTTQAPSIRQFKERDVVAVQVVDTLDGDSARGDSGGEWGGAVRPLLKWATRFSPDKTPVRLHDPRKPSDITNE